MRDHGRSLVEVGLERAALNLTRGFGSTSAPQAGDVQDELEYRDAVLEG